MSNYIVSKKKPIVGDKGFIVGNRFIPICCLGRIQLVSPTNMSSFENESFQMYSTGQYSDRYIWLAFDGNLTTFCDARGSTNPRFFGWKNKKYVNTCEYYEIIPVKSGLTEDNMCEWSLQGSVDGQIYEEIHHVSNYTEWKSYEPSVFQVKSKKFYNFFKIVCLKSGNNSTNVEYVPYIVQFKMYGHSKKI